jgi:tryptophan synthase alpha chain
MDGPVIAEAVRRSLQAGARVTDVLRTVEAVAASGVAVLVMTYWNPVDQYGVDAFARDLAAAGGSGLITPDLPPEEAGAWLAASEARGLDRVFLAAPSSTDQRLATIAGACRGFVYAASLMGITGTRDSVSGEAAGLVRRIRPHTGLPVAVGLGVSNSAQAAQVAEFADGVIVGSAFVRRLLEAADVGQPAAGARAAADLTMELAAAVRKQHAPLTERAASGGNRSLSGLCRIYSGRYRPARRRRGLRGGRGWSIPDSGKRRATSEDVS